MIYFFFLKRMSPFVSLQETRVQPAVAHRRVKAPPAVVSLAYLCTSVRNIDLHQKVNVAADSIFRSLLFSNMKPENHFVHLKLLSSHWFVVGIQKNSIFSPPPSSVLCKISVITPSSIISLFISSRCSPYVPPPLPLPSILPRLQIP